MKIMAIGDVHAKSNNTHVIDMLGDKLAELIRRQSPDMIVILGDLANDFDKMHLSAWMAINNFLDKVCSAATTDVYYVVGNHDMLNNQCFLTNENYFSFIESRPNLVVVDKAYQHGSGIVMCPYVPPGKLELALDTIPDWKDSTRLIFCHQEFMGAKMGAIESRHGDIWPEDYPQIVSGHIHDRDLLQVNILYVGAPYQTSFGDNENKTIEFIDYDLVSGVKTHTPYDLGMPKKINVRCDYEKFKTLEINPSDDVRVLVKDTTENIKKLKNTKKYSEMKKVCKVITKPVDPAKVLISQESKGFLKILEESINDETPNVKKVYKEVINDFNKTE